MSYIEMNDLFGTGTPSAKKKKAKKAGKKAKKAAKKAKKKTTPKIKLKKR